MVLVNIKTTNGAKAKAARFKRKSVTTGKARMLMLAKSRAVANIRVGGFAGIELKFVDAARGDVAMSLTWASVQPGAGITDCISAPGIGTSESQRDGRVFTIKSIHVKGAIALSATESQAAPIADEAYRVCVVWDTQTNGAAVTATQVMDANASTDINAFRNLQNSKRFIVLYDSGVKTITAFNVNEGAINLFASNVRRHWFKMNKTFKEGIKVRTIGTTADVASISDNSISVIAIATSTAVLIGYESRCRFVG